mmetsp:Transcript_86298/g.277019  ORF Transcript_86298/g.277019 Transcript_86298/m.277019 type:complete len:311 (-) Transcript_86298:162-1094(-)|eukprot:CAMPEP_0183445954 /NCGR_PEP_ID=MMETSP0370-20130417/96633_1 /TAXON_ID=268820 /ORGANISM="Peridinium aciculiferum, Strain PAER-2" /LENGTH=310 /DNA_ID=CAMNT_0025636619 /DNA_START=58 /DNA_END=990 /DNA_ORIENTATION=-
MGNSVVPRACCCGSGGELSAAAMDMVSVEHGLSPSTGFLKELQITGALGQDEEVEFDYDMELSTGIRHRSRGDATVRKHLLKAARSDDAPTVLQLVADGADLTVVGEALRLAAYRGSACVVRELVAVGLSVNEACPYTGMTSLQLAAGSGHILVCELLLDAMADVHGPQSRGSTAIELARKKGHVEVQEVIERHVAAMLLIGKGEEQDEGGAYRRAHVLPRVSPVLSEAVLQALPIPSVAETNEFHGDIDILGSAGCGEPDAAAGGFGGAGVMADSPMPDECDSLVAQRDASPLGGSPWRELPPQQVMPL